MTPAQTCLEKERQMPTDAMPKLNALIQWLGANGFRPHFHCEDDSYFDCKAINELESQRGDGVCDCGADAYNAELRALIEAAQAEIASAPPAPDETGPARLNETRANCEGSTLCGKCWRCVAHDLQCKLLRLEQSQAAKTIADLAAEIHVYARAKGWYDGPPRNIGEMLALIHGEISEALEAHRDGHMAIYYDGDKPCGFPVEIADAIIRALDLCAYLSIDINEVIALKMAYNKTRPYRHGGKRA